MAANLDLLALVETLDNGKPIREFTDADLPLCVDHSGAIMRASSALRKVVSPKSTMTLSPIISSISRWASLV